MTMILSAAVQLWQSLPRPVTAVIEQAVSLGAGLLLALMLHYLLYRISLPGTPFIYVVF